MNCHIVSLLLNTELYCCSSFLNRKMHHGRGKPHHHHHRPVNVNIGFTPSAPMANVAYMPNPPVVVNHIPPASEQGAEIGYKWVSTNKNYCSSLESTAVVAGYEGHDRSPIYVGRAHYNGEIIPCKVIPRHRIAYVAHDMKEIPVDNFEMYCKQTISIEWVSGNNGSVPPGAVNGGRTNTGETLYIGRVNHQGSLTPGKIHPSHGSCYISFGGREVAYKSYEVMVHRVY